MKKLAFIYNPCAGKGKIQNHLTDILNNFTKGDCEVTVLATKRKNHCREYIENEGARFDEVIISGGDGTVNEAFNALMKIEGEKPVLGYIPMGTTNDFASSCMIPTDPFEASKVAIDGKEVLIDAGKFNDEYFSYVAAFGVFTDVAYDTPQQIKNMFGRAAYIVEGIKRLASVKTFKMKIKARDFEVEDEFVFGMIANSNSVAGVNIKSMEVDLSDGLFEVFLLKKIEKPADFNMIVADLVNKNRSSKYYSIFKTDKVLIESENEVKWTLDGEFGGEVKNALIENVRRAVKIKVADI